ncbi:MAG: hypothetical protein WBQ50_21425 [Nocardioides sp.]
MFTLLAVLAAFPLGMLLRNRLAAYVAFGLAFAHLFTFQTAQLVLEATRGSEDAFGDLSDPDWKWFGDTIGYFEVTTLIYAVGLGLVSAGHVVRARRTRNLQNVG